MTLLGNFVEMSGQEEHDPFKWNKRSGRSMRGQNQRLHQEGMGSRTASHAVHTPPIHPLFSLFSCPYKISQQSHLSRTSPIYRPCVDISISDVFCSCSLSALDLIHELSECATKGKGIRPLKGRGPEMRLYYCSVVVMSMKKVGACRFVSATFWLMAALVEHPMIRLIQC